MTELSFAVDSFGARPGPEGVTVLGLAGRWLADWDGPAGDWVLEVAAPEGVRRVEPATVEVPRAFGGPAPELWRAEFELATSVVEDATRFALVAAEIAELQFQLPTPEGLGPAGGEEDPSEAALLDLRQRIAGERRESTRAVLQDQLRRLEAGEPLPARRRRQPERRAEILSMQEELEQARARIAELEAQLRALQESGPDPRG